MPDATIDYLDASLQSITCYLEYGSGGSTYLAATKQVSAIYSVESDAAFSSAVREKIFADFPSVNLTIVNVDLGKTGEWGYPRNKKKSGNWHLYPIAVWQIMESRGHSPDLVLIDGRFRVSCCLTSLLCARPGTRILIDDYAARGEIYGIIERFSGPIEMIDRAALLTAHADLDIRELALELASHCADPR
jgi:hypothetical protein